MMTLEKFEEASELVKKVTNPTPIYFTGIPSSDWSKGLFKTGKYAAHRSL